MATQVPTDVFEAITAVRDTGLTNMLDRPRVIEILVEMGCDDEAEWIREHKEDYAAGIFYGFEPVDE